MGCSMRVLIDPLPLASPVNGARFREVGSENRRQRQAPGEGGAGAASIPQSQLQASLCNGTNQGRARWGGGGGNRASGQRWAAVGGASGTGPQKPATHEVVCLPR